jgi:hypothetical protein
MSCNSNSFLDGLQAKADALKASVNGGLEGLKNDLGDAVAGLKGAITLPASPAVKSFKADLAALQGKVGTELAIAQAKLNETWGGIVNDLDTLMTKVHLPGFSVCSDAPNVEATTNPDGSLAPVVKAQPTPAPAEVPAPAEPVDVTPISQEVAPSSSSSGVSWSKAQADYAGYREVKEASYGELIQKSIGAQTEADKLKKDPDVMKVNGQDGSFFGPSSSQNYSAADRLRKGMVTQAQYDKYTLSLKKSSEAAELHGAVAGITDLFVKWEWFVAGKGGQEGAIRSVGDGIVKSNPSSGPYIPKVEGLVKGRIGVVTAYYNTAH